MITISRLAPRVLASALTLAALAAIGTAQDFGRVVAFGDSLVDNGNRFRVTGQPGPPYYKGRSSDGPVFVEQLAATLRIPLENYGYAESTTTEVFERQVVPFIQKNAGRIPGDALYVHWAGAIDLLNLIEVPGGDPAKVITVAMQQTGAAITALAMSGAQSVLVVNQPDFSKVPRVLATNDPTTIAGAGLLAQSYNQALAGVLLQLEAALKIEIFTVDAFQLTRDIVADPKSHVLWVVDSPRLQPNGKVRCPANRYLFFDDIHPTTAGHRLVMRLCLTAIGRVIPGDVNGDLLVNYHDLRAILPLRGRCFDPPCAADLNQDRWINFKDKLLLFKMLQPR